MKPNSDQLFRQNSISNPAAISGVGIHSGKTVQLRLLPAPPNTGVRFRRVDCGGIEIPALASHVSSLELATTLGVDDITISTVEHLLAAVQVLGVDNLIVEVDGPEVPILDGSAKPYLLLLQAAGIKQQNAKRKIVAVTQPLDLEVDGKRIRVSPYPGLRISYTIDFGERAIGRQGVEILVDPHTFESELASARTFALHRDVERMREAGLGLGGTPDNCVVFDDRGAMNTELRYDNEPVRHKALDAIGDLALLGAPIWGHVEVERGGHLVHFRLMEALDANPHCWTWMQSESREDTAGADLGTPVIRPQVGSFRHLALGSGA